MSLMLRAASEGSHSSRRAASSRCAQIQSDSEQASPPQARCSVLGDSRSRAAISATPKFGSRSRSRTSALICSRWKAVSCDTGVRRAAGSADSPAMRICDTLSATAAADSGASVPMSAASVPIMLIIRCPAPLAPLTRVAVSRSVSRSAVRSVGPGSISTICWKGPSKVSV